MTEDLKIRDVIDEQLSKSASGSQRFEVSDPQNRIHNLATHT